MIRKLLMIFLTIFTHAFAIIVTDKNSHCKFNIRQIERIGKIRIDYLFINFVSGNYAVYNSGKNHQKALLNYIQKKCRIHVEDINYQHIKQLIHCTDDNLDEIIDLQYLINSLVL